MESGIYNVTDCNGILVEGDSWTYVIRGDVSAVWAKTDKTGALTEKQIEFCQRQGKSSEQRVA